MLLFFVASLVAQNLNDDFSDGDLLNPSWTGDLANFRVENQRLRLNAPAAGSSRIQLSQRTATDQAVVYEFFVLLDFAPSAGNLATITLEGFRASGPVVYTLRVGGISGDLDALVFSGPAAKREPSGFDQWYGWGRGPCPSPG
ncbi:MAG: hypothetical protein HC821_04445 [Lewinella sp.]|nr:hypothetical protein [Lewinella sp.]